MNNRGYMHMITSQIVMRNQELFAPVLSPIASVEDSDSVDEEIKAMEDAIEKEHDSAFPDPGAGGQPRPAPGEEQVFFIDNEDYDASRRAALNPRNPGARGGAVHNQRL